MTAWCAGLRLAVCWSEWRVIICAQPPDRALSGVDLEKNTGNYWKSAGFFRASGVENLEKVGHFVEND